ncbi:MAG: hypothetical protein LBF89_04540 [Bacteroidales bacterium]|jgi:hypothetical protein|nr:hypothetical protein [Bacteroidales bacterium]
MKKPLSILTVCIEICSVICGQSEKARIKIDIERQIDRIDRMIYGNFVECPGRCIYRGLYESGSSLYDGDGFPAHS